MLSGATPNAATDRPDSRAEDRTSLVKRTDMLV
jgi:hypothetical protein